MDNTSHETEFKRYPVLANRVPNIDCGCANPRIRARRFFTEFSRECALNIIEAILNRGNYAQMKNVAGQYYVVELELS